MPWYFNPDSGGQKIPKNVAERTRMRIEAYAEAHYKGKYTRLDIRFRGQFCYMDAYVEPDLAPDFPPPGIPGTREEHLERMRNTPMHLGRLRYFGGDRWTYAFYTYSHNKYELSMFENGEFFGTPEEAFKIGAMYLDG